jgi:hypothetical protein
MNQRKEQIIVTSFAIATGLTIVQLILFFVYFQKDTQKSINKQLKKAGKFISTSLTNVADISDEEVFIFKKNLEPLRESHLKINADTNWAAIIKSTMLIFTLIIVSSFAWFIYRPTAIKKTIGSIIFGIVTGAVAQYLFIVNFVTKYKTKSEESIYVYILNSLQETLTSFCPN